MLIRRVSEADVVLAAADLFDRPPTPEWTAGFLGSPGHHLLFAFDAERPIGMVTGVEMCHPDKGAEMFLYELGVHEDAQGRGVGRALVRALAELARDRGCYGMWVLTERDNDAALATYRAAGGRDEGDHRLLEWDFRN